MNIFVNYLLTHDMPTQTALELAYNSESCHHNPESKHNNDILQSLDDLSTYNGDYVLNSNTSYNISIDGFSNMCGSCQMNATFGWKLFSLKNYNLLNESYVNFTSFPSSGFYKSFSRTLPSFSHNETGTFILRYGIFNSEGNPNSDMYSNNNINEITLFITTILI